MEICTAFYSTKPTNKGVNGRQIKSVYENDDGSFGTISLKFYPTTFRVLVQGNSSGLRSIQHMPVFRQQVEQAYSSDSHTWDARYSDQRISHNRKPINQTLSKIINPVIKKIGKIRQPLATLSSSFTKTKKT